MFATQAVRPFSVRVRPFARIHFIGKPGPSSPVRPRSDAYRNEPGQLLTFAGIAQATAVGGFGYAARPATDED
ncbi:MAG TPA: hypothetical protein VGM28_05060 [Candidatus Limnocylindrales bacterium]|jgi:hypothetical protein